MRSLTLRGVPDSVYSHLQLWAKENRRSLQEQVKMIIEREVRLAQGNHISRAKSLREKLAGRKWGNITAEIRRERQR